MKLSGLAQLRERKALAGLGRGGEYPRLFGQLYQCQIDGDAIRHACHEAQGFFFLGAEQRDQVVIDGDRALAALGLGRFDRKRAAGDGFDTPLDAKRFSPSHRNRSSAAPAPHCAGRQ